MSRDYVDPVLAQIMAVVALRRIRTIQAGAEWRDNAGTSA